MNQEKKKEQKQVFEKVCKDLNQSIDEGLVDELNNQPVSWMRQSNDKQSKLYFNLHFENGWIITAEKYDKRQQSIWSIKLKEKLFGWKGGLISPFECKFSLKQGSKFAVILLNLVNRNKQTKLDRVKEEFFGIKNGIEKMKHRHNL